MSKLTLDNVTNITGQEASAISTINTNSDRIEAALENTLSLDGTSPNAMQSDLDMNNNDILNAGLINADSLIIGGVQGGSELFSVGPQGDKGWSPVYSIVANVNERVLRLVDYVGGDGDKPTDYINYYVGASGMVVNIGDAVNIRGQSGSGSGDLISTNNLSDVSNASTSRTNLGLVIGSDVQAYSSYLAQLVSIGDPGADRIYFWDDSAGSVAALAVGNSLEINNTTLRAPTFWEYAISDETTAITTGTAKLTVRAPYAFTVTAVRASLSTASSSGNPTVDINENGNSILSTKLSIDANEKTSTTAATAAVISDTSIADDAELTFDIDTAGTGAKGLKVKIYGYRT